MTRSVPGRRATAAPAPPRTALPLAAGDVHLWWADLDAPHEPHAHPARLLVPDERRRAARFVAARDRSRFVAARAALRSLLARYLAVDPRDVPIRYGPAGKPEVGAAHTGLEFNLAHSGGLALFAFARSRRVGIDVEVVRPIAELEEVARRVCTPDERRHLAGLGPGARCAAFLRAWTRKEALAKGAGTGLAMAFERLDVPLDASPAPTAVRLEARGAEGPWWLHAIDVGPGYAAAVAVEGAGHRPPARPRAIARGPTADGCPPRGRCSRPGSPPSEASDFVM